MSSYNCNKCNKPILDSDKGYTTECVHYPKEEIIIKELKKIVNTTKPHVHKKAIEELIKSIETKSPHTS